MSSSSARTAATDRRREGFAEGSRPVRRWLCVGGFLIPLAADEAQA
jgi:hypothetical protein